MLASLFYCTSKAASVTMTETKPSYASGLLFATQQQYKDSQSAAGTFTYNHVFIYKSHTSDREQALLKLRVGETTRLVPKQYPSQSRLARHNNKDLQAMQSTFACNRFFLLDTHTMLRTSKPHSESANVKPKAQQDPANLVSCLNISSQPKLRHPICWVN